MNKVIDKHESNLAEYLLPLLDCGVSRRLYYLERSLAKGSHAIARAILDTDLPHDEHCLQNLLGQRIWNDCDHDYVLHVAARFGRKNVLELLLTDERFNRHMNDFERETFQKRGCCRAFIRQLSACGGCNCQALLGSE